MNDLKKVYKDYVWYTQGIAAVPMILSVSASSGFEMNQEDPELDYKHFLFRYDGTRAEMLYDLEELKRLWEFLRPKLINDNSYLKNISDKYNKSFELYNNFFPPLSAKQLVKLTDQKLIDLFHTAIDIQRDSVGLGHIIEPISIVGTDYIYERIKAESVKTKNISQLISDLFEPTQKSFLYVEEEELRGLTSLPFEKQEKGLLEHQQKYYWIENTYLAAKPVTVDYLRERMLLLKETVVCHENVSAADKNQLMEDMGLSKETKVLVEALNFCTTWQDDRKINILKSVSLIDGVIREISRRAEVDSLFIKYLGVHEAKNIHQLSELVEMEKMLKSRSHKSYFYLEKEEETFSDQETFEEISTLHHPDGDREYSGDIRGMSACQGVAIAEVRICTSLEEISDFPEGSVLVTHMTRPEYAPAMKKAAAIVTDEGGITSHAAIVSRELGVPCIIGTQNATKRLKNGDLVEVRANHGLVRIIKQVEL